MTKYKVQLNDAANIKDLLQITYNLADEQLIQAQNEMNKLANATRLQEEVMDSKQKYSKAMNDYMTIKDKAIRTKLDIAKLMTEILTHNGDVKKAIDATSVNSSTFDIKKIRKMVNDSYKDSDNNTTTIELKK